VLLGVAAKDEKQDADYLLEKILNLRIFEDIEGKMNLSLLDIAGELLVVSQFTLYGDVRRGRRPSFIEAAPPQKAEELYEYFVSEAQKHLSKVATGKFQAMMDVNLTNDGPVTILIDSKKDF
jgi:D-tyrosyl-tRNA(Tyr) deacylase